MLVNAFTFAQYHGKKETPGSTKIRIDNMIKYWPELSLYKYGNNPDALIFQKVYCTYDYKFHQHFEGIKILDVCDTDWTQTPDIYIKETLDAVDAAVAPTESLCKLLRTMTDTPVRHIKDRFDLSEFPARKNHKGKAKRAVWFGYAHNATLLRYAVPSLESRGIDLIVVSDEDPYAYKWANDSQGYQAKYTYIKYNQDTVYSHLQSADICVMPKGFRPEDKYKSENKTVIAQLCGLPVVSSAEEIDAMLDGDARNKAIEVVYNKLREEYDVMKSISEYKELIQELSEIRANGKS